MWEDFGSAWVSGWCTELTNAVLVWEGWMGVLSFKNKQKNPQTLRSLDTLSLSALDCLFRTDFRCKRVGRRLRSCLANPCGQTGPSRVSPAFIPHAPFWISYHRLPYPACIFSLMHNLTETVESDSLAAQGVRVEHRGSVLFSHEARWCHTLALVVRILDHRQKSGSGANSSKGREPKRITGNCISKGPCGKNCLKKKKNLKKEKQLYLESTETDMAEVNSQGSGESEFISHSIPLWHKSQRDGKKGSRQGDHDAR